MKSINKILLQISFYFFHRNVFQCMCFLSIVRFGKWLQFFLFTFDPFSGSNCLDPSRKSALLCSKWKSLLDGVFGYCPFQKGHSDQHPIMSDVVYFDRTFHNSTFSWPAETLSFILLLHYITNVFAFSSLPPNILFIFGSFSAHLDFDSILHCLFSNLFFSFFKK